MIKILVKSKRFPKVGRVVHLPADQEAGLINSGEAECANPRRCLKYDSDANTYLLELVCICGKRRTFSVVAGSPAKRGHGSPIYNQGRPEFTSAMMHQLDENINEAGWQNNQAAEHEPDRCPKCPRSRSPGHGRWRDEPRKAGRRKKRKR